MKSLELFLYGVILGHFLLRSLDKLSPRVVRHRFAVVAQHCAKDEFVLVGYADELRQFRLVLELVGESAEYIDIGYDLSDSRDRIELNNLKLVEFDDLDSFHKSMLEEARALCHP